MKNIMKYALLTVGIMTVCGVAFAQSGKWGGKGHVSVNPAKVARGGSVEIKYTVTESRGTGLPGFKCEVTGPGGVVHIATIKDAAEWSGGSTSGTCAYPGDFGGNDDIQPSTRASGTYQVQCYWYIEGYGVNGKVAAAGGAFIVE